MQQNNRFWVKVHQAPSFEHYTPTILAFTLDQASPLEAITVVREIMSCNICYCAFEEFRYWFFELGHPHPRVAAEFVSSFDFLSRLLRYQKERRIELVQNDELFQIWGLASHLLRLSKDALAFDKNSALDHACLAATVTEHLNPGFYGVYWVKDLQGRAHLQVSRCLLALGDLEGAEVSLGKAREALEEGTGQPRLAVDFDYQEALLWFRRGEKARALLLFENTLSRAVDILLEPAGAALPWSFQTPWDFERVGL